MKIEVRVPTLSDSVASGSLLPWRKAVGERVARDETLVDLETDKVILEIPAPASGVLLEIRAEEGANLKADEVIAVIETEGVAVAAGAASAPTPAGAAPAPEAKSVQAGTPSPSRAQADRPSGIRGECGGGGEASAQASTPVSPKAPSPLAGEGRGEGGLAGADAGASPPLAGRAPAGTPEPLVGRGAGAANSPTSPQPSPVRGANTPAVPLVTTLPPASGRPDTAPAPTRREPMSRLRKRVAERLVEAQHTAAMLTTFNEVNMAPVNELRQRLKAEFEVKHGVKLGYMSFFVRAVCAAMREFPVVNAAIDGDDIVWRDDVDIGIAVSTPRGLVVPILRRCQTLAAHDIEAAIADFGRRAKEGKLALEELAGGSFSITNGGVFGSLLSTPILNPPQSAILGMHAIQDRPVAEHGQVVIRPMMYLALTYDHRLVDGRDAVQFLVAVKKALEAPEALP